MNKYPEVPNLFYSTWGTDFYSEHWLKPINCWMLAVIKFVEANIDLDKHKNAIRAYEKLAGSDLMFIYPDKTQRELVSQVFAEQYRAVVQHLPQLQPELLCTYPVDPFKTLFIYVTPIKPQTAPQFLIEKTLHNSDQIQQQISIEPNYTEFCGLHIYHQFFMMMPDSHYQFRLDGGSSTHKFTTPHFGIPLYVVNQLKMKPKYNQSTLYEKLKKIWGKKDVIPRRQDKTISSKVIHQHQQLQKLLAGKTVAVFKYNKEFFSLLRFKELSPYQLSVVFDEAIALDDASEYIQSESSNIPVISNINKIDNWNFDAIILTCAINYETEIPFVKALMRRAVAEKMPVVSLYDDILEFDVFPQLNVDASHFYCIGLSPDDTAAHTPVNPAGEPRAENILAVFGTDTVQGKFTTQLYLREALKKHLRVAHWATEPTGTLLGADIGYSRSYNGLSEQDRFDYETSQIKQLAANHDLVITGGQNSIIFTMPDLPREQNASTFIFNTFLPRYLVLTVAVDTPVKLVEESIAYIDELAAAHKITTQVIALAMMEGRKMHGSRWTDTYFSAVDEEVITTAKKRMKEKFDLPLYVIPAETDALAAQITGLIKEHE